MEMMRKLMELVRNEIAQIKADWQLAGTHGYPYTQKD